MNMKEPTIELCNNVIWKCYKNNKYPLQIYRDNRSSVFRDKDFIYLFPDYDIPNDKVLEIVNSCASRNPVIIPDLQSGEAANRDGIFNMLHNVTKISPSYNFMINSYTDAPLELGIFVLKLGSDDILYSLSSYRDLSDSSTPLEVLLDEGLNYVGRDIVKSIECKITNYRNDLLNGVIPPRDIPDNSFLAKIKGFFRSNNISDKDKYIEKFKYFYEYITDESGCGCHSRINITPIIFNSVTKNLFKQFNKDNIDLISPITIIFTIY